MQAETASSHAGNRQIARAGWLPFIDSPLQTLRGLAEKESFAHVSRAAVRPACRTLRIPRASQAVGLLSPPTKNALAGVLLSGGGRRLQRTSLCINRVYQGFLQGIRNCSPRKKWQIILTAKVKRIPIER
jgi:hypothetical protein